MSENPSMRMRLAHPSDRPAIEAMAAEVVASGEMFVFEHVDDVLAYWYDPTGALFVAEIEGAVVGTFIVKPNQKGRGAHVANAGYMVPEAMRRRGVGEAMGRRSLDVARQLGYRAMQFNMVVTSNPSAVRLWERLGFRVVGTVPDVFRRPCGAYAAAHVMYREL